MRNLVICRIIKILKEYPDLDTEVSMQYGNINSLSNVELLNLYESLLCEDDYEQ